MPDMLPEQLFMKLRKAKTQESVQEGIQTVNLFKAIQDKSAFLEPAIQFLEMEQEDRVRSWSTNILEAIGGDRAFEALKGALKEKETLETKRQYLYTRFFALRGLNAIADTDQRKLQVKSICQRIQKDDDEDFLARSGAAALLANQGDKEAFGWLKNMLARTKEYWPVLRAARALAEFPVASLSVDLLAVINQPDVNLDHLWQVVRALPRYAQNPDVAKALISLARDHKYSFIKEDAVVSLGKLGDPSAMEVLLNSLQEKNAEIRYQAAIALAAVAPVEKAANAIIQEALDPDLAAVNRSWLADALRVIDPGRSIPTEILSRELAAEDRQRSEMAEQMLIDLGGWSAVQRLSQRRTTLNRLDNLLSDSEKVVRDTFEGTIRQARFNFYFAMSVNMLIVLTGIALVVLAITQLVQNPQQLASWLLPGATGVIGVLINLVFNNPRHNARNDLTALLNVNVIFLGYLRQLNEIDATFKHAYLENPDFSSSQMQETVQQINQTVEQTLNMALKHLSHADESKENNPAQPTNRQSGKPNEAEQK